MGDRPHRGIAEMRRTCLFLSSHFPPPMIGGSLVFYHYLLSGCSDRDVLVLTQRKPGAEGFDRSVSYGVFRSRVVRDDSEPRLEEWCGSSSRCPGCLWGSCAGGPLSCMWAPGRWWCPLGWHVGSQGESWSSRSMERKLTTDSDAMRGIPFRLLWRVYDHLARGALRGADLVHTNSRFTEKVLLDRGVRQDRIRVMNPGIDLEKAQGPARIDAVIEARLAGKRVLLTVGRLQARKGQDMMLQALPELLEDTPTCTM